MRIIFVYVLKQAGSELFFYATKWQLNLTQWQRLGILDPKTIYVLKGQIKIRRYGTITIEIVCTHHISC